MQLHSEGREWAIAAALVLFLTQSAWAAEATAASLSPQADSSPVDGWSDGIHVGTNWNSSRGLDMAVDSQGNRHFVWFDIDTRNYHVIYQLNYMRLSPTNQVLIDRMPISTPSSLRITTAAIVLNTNDTPIIAYMNTDGREREGNILYFINQMEINSTGIISKENQITNFSVKARGRGYRCDIDKLVIAIDSFNNIHTAVCDTLLTMDQDGKLLKHYKPYASSVDWVGSPSIIVDQDDNLYLVWSQNGPNDKQYSCVGSCVGGAFTETYLKVFDYTGVVIVNNTLLQQGSCNSYPTHVLLDNNETINVVWKNDTFWGGEWSGTPYEPHDFKVFTTFYRSIVKKLSPLDIQTTLIHQTPSHPMSLSNYYSQNTTALLGVGVSFDDTYHIFSMDSLGQFTDAFNNTYLITNHKNSTHSTTFINLSVLISSISVATDNRGRVYFAWIQHNNTKIIDFNYGEIYYRHTLQAGPVPPLPDLSIDRKKLVLSPNPALPSVNITIEATVVNLAPATARHVVVQFLVDEVVVGEMRFLKVKGYESIPVHWEWAPPDTGTYEIELRVDPANNIRESDEENNRVQTTLRVVATPPHSTPSLLLTLPGMLFLIAITAVVTTRNRDFGNLKLGPDSTVSLNQPPQSALQLTSQPHLVRRHP